MKSCSDTKGELGSAAAHRAGHWPGSRGTAGEFQITGAPLGLCLAFSMDTRWIFGCALPWISSGAGVTFGSPKPLLWQGSPLAGGQRGAPAPKGLPALPRGTRHCT